MREFLLRIKPAYVIIILLTLISQRISYNEIVYPQAEWRIEMEDSILKGDTNPPYQYRVLKPMLGRAIQTLISPLIKNDVSRHLLSYKILLFIVFFLIFLFLYLYLRHWFSEIASIVGMLLFQILIPLSITSQWQEGDFITVVIYLAAFLAFIKNKEFLLPIIILIGALNREQTIFILVFYAAWLFAEKRLFTAKSYLIIGLSLLAFAISYFGMRFIIGFRPNEVHTIGFNVTQNLENIGSILRLWAEQILIFVIISIAMYKRSALFFRYSFLLLIPYTILFFLNGIMGETAKYLPAFLIMIPMTLQFINKENTDGKAKA